MKVELNATGNNERISVFVDPDPSKSETENAGSRLLKQHEADVFNNSSNITHIGFWAWDIAGLYPRMDELRLGTTWDAVTPTEVSTLYAYEPFSGYTPGVQLDGAGKGQTSIGFDPPTDWVSPSWGSKIVADADGLTYAATLKLVSSGGSAANIGGPGYITYNDLRALRTAVDADLTKIYVSGVARYTQLLNDYAGFGISREATGTTGARALSLGVTKSGGTSLRHSYGANAKAGVNAYGSAFTPGTNTYFYVARVDMNVGAASQERITIYLNPDPALSEFENASALVIYNSDAELFANSSAVSHIHLWAWDNPNGASFDEIRVGSSWASVTPCKPLTAKGTMIVIQ